MEKCRTHFNLYGNPASSSNSVLSVQSMNIHILKSPTAAFPFVTCDNMRAFTIEITVYFLLYFKITVQSGIRNSFSCNLWRENKEEKTLSITKCHHFYKQKPKACWNSQKGRLIFSWNLPYTSQN